MKNLLMSAAIAFSLSPPAWSEEQDPETVLDLLVVYSDEVSDSYGGAEGVKNRANELIKYANVALNNSDVNITINIIHTAEIPLEHDNKIYGFLKEEARTNADITRVRTVHKPDLTLYLAIDVYAGSGAAADGIAFFEDAFIDHTYGLLVVNPESKTEVFAHELGHTLGAGHGWRSPFNTQLGHKNTEYAMGYGVLRKFRTLMTSTSSYETDRIQYYSNPDIEIPGICGPTQELTCGTADANSAAGMRVNFNKYVKDYSTKWLGASALKVAEFPDSFNGCDFEFIGNWNGWWNHWLIDYNVYEAQCHTGTYKVGVEKRLQAYHWGSVTPHCVFHSLETGYTVEGNCDNWEVKLDDDFE